MNIYEEAVKNSLDAGADKIDIIIKKKKKISDAELTIIDNGTGFNQSSFNRFSVLGKKADIEHKGLGRVVYLMYYGEVKISSTYQFNGEWLKRDINFTDDFNPKSAPDLYKEEKSSQQISRTELMYKRLIHQKIHDSKFIDVHYVRSFLFAKFLSEFYTLKQKGKDVVITIRDEQEGEDDLVSNDVKLSSTDFPTFDTRDIDLSGKELFDIANPKTKILYKIENDYSPINSYEQSIITAISVDGRSFEVNIIDLLPPGFRVIFLLHSEEKIFKSKPDRSGLDIDNDKLKKIEEIFKSYIINMVEEKIPEIKSENKKTIREINKKYPFLIGYLESTGVTLYRKDRLIDDAHTKYNKDKKALLDLQNLSDSQFDNALKISSRVLTEYILHRETVIRKIDILQKNGENDETLLHNVIIPQKDVYVDAEIELQRNNIWLFDDKFMSFSTVLSEQSIKQLFKSLDDEREGNDDRPDISIVFSKNGDSEQTKSADVVIIELKGQSPHKNDLPIIVKQIVDRAKVLSEEYPSKINRVWYYGVLGLSDSLKRDLYGSDRYHKMFSSDEYWYGQETFIPDYEKDPSQANRIQVDFFLLSYKALIDDAKSRNSTFLNLLRENITHND